MWCHWCVTERFSFMFIAYIKVTLYNIVPVKGPLWLVALVCAIHLPAGCTLMWACFQLGLSLVWFRVWARPHHCANPALQLKLSLKKTPKGTICPPQNLGKKLERKQTRRDPRNCKLYRTWKVYFTARCLFKVHSQVTSHNRKLFHSKSKSDWIREKWYRRRTVY